MSAKADNRTSKDLHFQCRVLTQELYCKYVQSRPIHKYYRDAEYGFPVREDCALLERLTLEIAPAGGDQEYSWVVC